MDVKCITVPNELMIKTAVGWLEEKPEIALRAVGRSMHPYIKDGKDELVFRRPDRSRLAVGDVVLGLTTHKRYVVHRIVRISGDMIILKGDGNLYGTECCRRHDIYGELVAIVRDGKRIDCNTKGEKFKALVMRSVYRPYRKTRGYIGKLLRKLNIIK